MSGLDGFGVGATQEHTNHLSDIVDIMSRSQGDDMKEEDFVTVELPFQPGADILNTDSSTLLASYLLD